MECSVEILAGITRHYDSIFEKNYNYKNSTVSEFFIQCLFEATDQKRYFLPHPVTFELFQSSTPLDMYALGYCIANSLAGEFIRVEIYSPSVSLEPFLHGFTTQKTQFIKFQAFHFVECWSAFPQLYDSLLGLSSLKLHFDNRKLTDENLLRLSELIPHMTCLTELGIGTNYFKIGGFPSHVVGQWWENSKGFLPEGFLRVLQSLSHNNVATLMVMNTEICHWCKKLNKPADNQVEMLSRYCLKAINTSIKWETKGIIHW